MSKNGDFYVVNCCVSLNRCSTVYDVQNIRYSFIWNVLGKPGNDGTNGKDGKMAGTAGSGGSAPGITFNMEQIIGHLSVNLMSGKGGDSLPHGYGGKKG